MQNNSVVDLFERNELNISNLYSIYANKIPQKSKLWNKLAGEEIDHAAEIRSEMGEFGEDQIAETNFSSNIIDYVMNFVLEETKKAEELKTDHRHAVLTALRIERSMLEKKLFDIFVPSSETVRNVMEKMNRETEKHVQILLDEMKKCKYKF